MPKGYRLVVVEPAGRESCGQMRYKCVWDCDKEKAVDSISLIRGLTKSYGRLNADPARLKLPEHDLPIMASSALSSY